MMSRKYKGRGRTIALCSGALFLASVGAGAYLLASRNAESRRVLFLPAHHAACEGIADEQFRLDASRVISGVAIDATGQGVASTVSLYDMTTLFGRIVGGLEMDESLPILGSPEYSGPTSADGRFSFRPDILGNKILVAMSPGFAPSRISDVLVCDGVPITDMTIPMEPSRLGFLSTAVWPQDAIEVLSVYRGWWPGNQWVAWNGQGLFPVERRVPDGWPRAIVLHGPWGTKYLEVGEECEGAILGTEWNVLPFHLEEYAEAAVGPYGLLWRCLSDSDIGRHVAGDESVASLTLQTPDGYGIVAVTDSHDHVVAAIADANGEVRVEKLRPDYYTVRANRHGGMVCYSRGVSIKAEGSSESLGSGWAVRFSRDMLVIGAILRKGVPVADVNVICVDSETGDRLGFTKSDRGGFYVISGVKEGRTYVVSAWEGDTWSVSATSRVTIPMGQHLSEVRSDVLIPDTALSLSIPGVASDVLSLEVRERRSERVVSAGLIAGGGSVTIRALPSGSYRCELLRAGRAMWTCPDVSVGDEQSASTVSRAMWEMVGP